MSRELTLICSTCAQEIGQDDGYLWAHTHEIHTVQQAHLTLEEQHTDPVDGSMLLDLADLADLPEPATWRADHHDCDPARQESHYRIPADRLRLRADLLDWTAHLMEKSWLEYTDWRDVVRETRTGGPRLAVAGPLPSPHRAV
ncbi:hypothetical protein [Streptomyces roseolus]|uniref:hypothetical protein n=1 Tax=Streptomyces roseolus TaxID=67358 RepID=UPI0037924992